MAIKLLNKHYRPGPDHKTWTDKYLITPAFGNTVTRKILKPHPIDPILKI